MPDDLKDIVMQHQKSNEPQLIDAFFENKQYDSNEQDDNNEQKTKKINNMSIITTSNPLGSSNNANRSD